MKDDEKRRAVVVPAAPTSALHVVARLDNEQASDRTGRFRVLDRSQRGLPTPHAGIAPLAASATSGTAISFTSHDHLGLGTHPRVTARVAALLDEESKIDGAMHRSAQRLAEKTEAHLVQLLATPHVVLTKNGQRTISLVLSELVGVGDRVLVDIACDRRILDAASSTAAGISRFSSIDPEGLLGALEEVRSAQPHAGILIVTQSYFPVDGQVPDLGLLRALGEHFDAALLVDATHDFGCVGPRGTGFLGLQSVLGFVELVTADLGRTFGSDAGFVATRSATLERRLARVAASPLPTVRGAELVAALELAASEVGDSLRQRIELKSRLFRSELSARGFHAFGNDAPIIPVLIGDPDVAAIAQQFLEGEGIVADLAMPRDPPNSARLIFRVTALHREAHVLAAVKALDTACAVVRAAPMA